MDSAVVNGATVWRSERLIYRGVEAYDEDFLTSFFADAESYTRSSIILPIPYGKKLGTEWREIMQDKHLLGVLICLPAPLAAATSSADLGFDQRLQPAKPIPIGVLSLIGAEPRMRHHRKAMISIQLIQQCRGQGYGSEAIKWVLRWAFRFGNLHRVEIGAVGYNEGALRLYERLGFAHEGRRREAVFFDGRYWDLVEMGMLKREWKAKYDQTGSKDESD